MRRIILVPTLVLAGCATRPEPQLPTSPTAPSQPIVQPSSRGQLIGLTPNELGQQLGAPALQIREGASVKLQFRDRFCVLDTYLYPSTGGQLRVTHVDARTTSGADTDQAACISSLSNPS